MTLGVEFGDECFKRRMQGAEREVLNAVLEGMGSGASTLGFESQSCHSLVGCLRRATDLTGPPFLVP